MKGKLRRRLHLEMRWRSIAPVELSKRQHPQLAMRWTLTTSRRGKFRAGGNEHELAKCILCHG